MSEYFRVEIGGRRSGRVHAAATKLLTKLAEPTEQDLRQFMADIQSHGIAIAKDGKRIDPAKFRGGREITALSFDEWPSDPSNMGAKNR